MAREGKLEKSDLLELINTFINVVKTEPNILKIQDPVTVVGDIHGQYYDLLKLLEVGGNPEETQYLFLGDYVDRGAFSIECVILLYALKVNWTLFNPFRSILKIIRKFNQILGDDFSFQYLNNRCIDKVFLILVQQVK